MRAFLQRLGDPHLRYPTIHVGGTSGKGSTATMIAAALTAAGKRTGLHTKPHLASMLERTRIDGRTIDEETFAELLAAMQPAIGATAADDGRPSYYETLLALSFVAFERAEVDAAVIEVGIGGTLDGTNLIQPEVSIVTNVGLDHTDVLGETIEEIARDKAGIAKPGVALVSDAREPARGIIQSIATGAGAPFIAVAEAATIAARPSEMYGQSFAVTTDAATYELALPVLGRFQQRNAATALVALEQLRPALRPSVAAVERGLGGLVIPGRMEFFPGFPGIVFDVAHNPDKSAGLAQSLAETFPERRFAFIVAIGESKNAVDVLRPFFGLSASFIFTAFQAPGRSSVNPQRLLNIAEQAGQSARAIADPIEALSVARRNADAAAIVVVTGSTFVVGALRGWWLTNVVERARN
jgi:dihydrofolate synthase/folylpolyglutamate synthase